MIRPYFPGDDVRHIDWNATARLQEPHVRVHVGERALTTWLVLDVSASMRSAPRIAARPTSPRASRWPSATSRRGAATGSACSAFGGGDPRIMRPRQGRLGLLALLAELRREREGEGAGATSLGAALNSAAALGRQRGLVVIVSDFRGERDWEAPLQALRARHGVMAVEIVDPREQELVPGRRPLAGRPRDGPPGPRRHAQAQEGPRRASPRPPPPSATRSARALRRAGADHVVLSTGGDWLRIFAAHLRRSETALRAGAPARAAVAQPDEEARG